MAVAYTFCADWPFDKYTQSPFSVEDIGVPWHGSSKFIFILSFFSVPKGSLSERPSNRSCFVLIKNFLNLFIG